MKKRCPDCNHLLKELRKALTDGKIVWLYPKDIVEPNVPKVYHEYRFYCVNCKKGWVYNSLFREFAEIPDKPQFVYSPDSDLLVERVEEEAGDKAKLG